VRTPCPRAHTHCAKGVAAAGCVKLVSGGQYQPPYTQRDDPSWRLARRRLQRRIIGNAPMPAAWRLPWDAKSSFPTRSRSHLPQWVEARAASPSTFLHGGIGPMPITRGQHRPHTCDNPGHSASARVLRPLAASEAIQHRSERHRLRPRALPARQRFYSAPLIRAVWPAQRRRLWGRAVLVTRQSNSAPIAPCAAV